MSIKPTRSRSGFTFFEILMVISVSSILMAIAMPRSSDRSRQAVKFAADRFARAHSLARATGIRMGRMGELHINAGTGRFWVESDTSGTGVQDTIGIVSDLSVEAVTMTSARTLLCFDGRGLPDIRVTNAGGTCEPANATIVFSRSGQADTVEITALGKVIR